MTPRSRILVVDDQESARTFLGRYLEEIGYRSVIADSMRAGLDAVRKEPVDLAIIDVCMPEMDGIEGLRHLKELDETLPVIMLTAYATVETAVNAMKLGAFDYVRKPIETEELEIVVARALEYRRLVEENRRLRSRVDERFRLENLIGASPAMRKVQELIRRVAPVDVPVLIVGESGTGKDLAANAIHGLSARRLKTFLSINCAAVPETLLESELFGHEKGAFSGAEKARVGYFREADGGTLFLDEIGDMSLAQQAKLLRVLESGELIPVGSERPQRVDVRLIAATNRDFDELVAGKQLREDLLYRLDTVRLRLPPLRERREDIPALAEHFIDHARLPGGRPRPRLSAGAMRDLMLYEWPGNVRELKHAIEHGVLIAPGEEIQPADLPHRVREVAGAARPHAPKAASGPYQEARRAFEQAYVSDLMKRASGNVSRAAQMAGMHRATLHLKLKQLGIKWADGDAREGSEAADE